jgi:hypothetical protein
MRLVIFGDGWNRGVGEQIVAALREYVAQRREDAEGGLLHDISP